MARVAVDVSLPHLDRPFDYLVQADQSEQAQPGVRVRVRFAGQLVDGFLLERAERSEHVGRLAYLERVSSGERVLVPEISQLARTVADRYAGALADVLRLAVPPRHARAEAQLARQDQVEPGDTPGPDPEAPPDDAAAGPRDDAAAPRDPAVDQHGWDAYRAGPGYLTALREGRAPRAVVTLLPGEDWPARLAEALAAAVSGGRGAVAVAPDARDLSRLDAAVTAILGPRRHVCLSAAIGPAERYRRFLRASRAAHTGEPMAVIGSRAAMFAPVAKLGLVVIWDDGDDLHAEPRAPYPHAREVLLTRAQSAQAGALVAGFSRTAEAQLLVAAGWAREVTPDRETVRARAPRVAAISDEALARDSAAATARLPSLAWNAARDAFAAAAPVLVQVPRRGYLPSVACARCRQPARCAGCAGPLALSSAQGPASCRWCGLLAADLRCSRCGSGALRASVVGARRTAEELGRAFPDVPVRTSGRDGMLDQVPAGPALVIATPGAEPIAEGGYGAALLLDTWALLTRPDLRAAEEALRRWLAVACLVRPATDGGRVVVVADGSLAPVQALTRFDPGWHAARELDERSELGFPPGVRMASVTGSPAAVAELLQLVNLPEAAEVLGPAPTPGQAENQERALIRVRRSDGPQLAAALHAASGVRSARKATESARVQIDPLDLW